MSLLSPISALFALALPAIILMYILKRTYRDKQVSSHLLWNRILREQEANRPWQRLRSRPLMLLQLLAAALLVLALMQPAVNQAAVSSKQIIIVMDRSASMTADGNAEETLFDQAVAKADQWVEELPVKSSVTIIATGEQPQIIVAKEQDRGLIREALNSIQPDFGIQDNAAAVSLADALIDPQNGGQIRLYTDGLWADVTAVNELQLHAPLEVVAAAGSRLAQNEAIVHFGVKASPNGSGSHDGVITLRNDSAAEKQMKVNVYADNSTAAAATKSVAVAPKGWASVTVSNLPEDAAFYKAQLSTTSDPFLLDNTAYQFPSTPRAQQVLLVSTGNLFLEKALQLAGVSTLKVNPNEYTPSDAYMDTIDWIVVDGDVAALKQDKSWTAMLSSKPVWYIDHPDARSEEAVVPANNRVEIAEHPVTAYLSFDDIHIGRMTQPKEISLWGEPIVTYGHIPAIIAGMAEGKPQLYFTFDMQNTDLPLRPEFPVLIVQAADWMSGGTRLELGTSIVNTPLALSLDGNTSHAAWEPVDQMAEYKSFIDARQLKLELAAETSFRAPAVPGLYRLMEYDEAGEVVGNRLLAATIDPVESSAMSGTAAISPVYAETEGTDHTKPDWQAVDAAQSTAAIAAWIACLLFVLLLGEWEVYRRGNAS